MIRTRVIVTGGYGFIGSRLCIHLASQGYEVVVIDNLALGTPANLPATIAQDIISIAADIRDHEAVTWYLEYYRPRTIYHLAAMHFIPACDANPLACIGVNVDGTQALLGACASASSVEAVVLASSAAVYKPSDTAHDEDSALGPTDIYGLSKLWTEQLGALFHRETGINVGVARIFNVFGPGETNAHLIPSIIQQLQHGHALRLGTLSTGRDYVFVDDVARALIALGQVCPEHGLLTCNVGSERMVDGYQLVHAIGALLQSPLDLQTDPARVRPSDRPCLLSNCQRAHELLGWHATTSLEDGLRAAFHRPSACGLVLA